MTGSRWTERYNSIAGLGLEDLGRWSRGSHRGRRRPRTRGGGGEGGFGWIDKNERVDESRQMGLFGMQGSRSPGFEGQFRVNRPELQLVHPLGG